VVWADFVTVPDGAAETEVMGQQWQWSFRLPGADGAMGTSDAKNITPENPFGLNPTDPKGQDDVLIQGQDLHLPLDKPVKILLRSIDVLHDFYVPQFRAKMDLVPGMVTYFWITPSRTGTFDVLCAELCGTGHHTMRGIVVVDDESAYQTWLAEQQTFAQSLAKAGDGAGNIVNASLSGSAEPARNQAEGALR
jgi:cytochrome c oxidase subunit 2